MIASLPGPYSVVRAEITARLFANCKEKESRHPAKYGLSTVEFRCSRILSDKDQLAVNQIAQKITLTCGCITRVSDGLMAKKSWCVGPATANYVIHQLADTRIELRAIRLLREIRGRHRG